MKVTSTNEKSKLAKEEALEIDFGLLFLIEQNPFAGFVFFALNGRPNENRL